VTVLTATHDIKDLIDYEGSGLEQGFYPDDFENGFINVLASMIKLEFTFFLMPNKGTFPKASKPGETCFGVFPEEKTSPSGGI